MDMENNRLGVKGSFRKQNLGIINEQSPTQGGGAQKCLLCGISELLPLCDYYISHPSPFYGTVFVSYFSQFHEGGRGHKGQTTGLFSS